MVALCFQRMIGYVQVPLWIKGNSTGLAQTVLTGLALPSTLVTAFPAQAGLAENNIDLRCCSWVADTEYTMLTWI
jgi:hypothetical protein